MVLLTIGKTGERIIASGFLENGHESVQFCTNRVVTPNFARPRNREEAILRPIASARRRNGR
jgi:hypothetical protein